MEQQEHWVSANEAARMVDVSVSTITYWIKTRRLPALRVSTSFAIRASDLEKANAASRTNHRKNRAAKRGEK